MTINYLVYTNNKSPFVKTITEVFEREIDDYNTSATSKDFLGSLELTPNNFEYR
ncbi:hypothetical protein [Algoriphagus aquimarinus]|uniref:hypothetical protein n=1 Tax=Algoriphagus aquimarinus TaxID=237018 RepID=UPI00174E9711|nr:hypothetical protein [Algoriphagus aquimarinus]